jgi:16S rRNA (guanine527-N7)-methyltransferase
VGDAPLVDALRASQTLGFLGRQSIEATIAHADVFVEALRPVTGGVVDLGSGGGVPGLVIAWRRADLHVTLTERRESRADHLRRLVARLGIVDRVAVDGRDVRHLPPGCADAVVARSFGPPARTVAAARRLLRTGGLLVVSEPPDGAADRWPDVLLRDAGLRRLAQPDRRVFVAIVAEVGPDVPRETST